MTEPNNAPSGQEPTTQTSGDVAAELFSDISNPAVESAPKEEPTTSSENEPVIPSVADFQKPVEDKPVEVKEEDLKPTTPAAPAVATPATPAAQPAAAPVQYTPEQIAQFQQWQAAQQQQIIPPPAAPQQQQQQPQAPAQLAPEEIDKAINRFRVTPEKFNELFTEEDPTKASAILDGMLQDTVKQAVTMSLHLIKDQAAQLQQSVAPYMQFADTQREVMLREQFFQNNPDLRGQDLVIGTVMQQLAAARQAGQYRPANEQQVFQDVATRTKALIAQMQQQGQHVAPQQGGVAPQGLQRKPTMVALPTASGGMGAGSANGLPSAANGESQAARSVFG